MNRLLIIATMVAQAEMIVSCTSIEIRRNESLADLCAGARRESLKSGRCVRHNVPLDVVTAYRSDGCVLMGRAVDAASNRFPNALPSRVALESGDAWTIPVRIEYCRDCTEEFTAYAKRHYRH